MSWNVDELEGLKTPPLYYCCLKRNLKKKEKKIYKKKKKGEEGEKGATRYLGFLSSVSSGQSY